MIGAIVLAAGSSRRFGSDKRKALLPNGNMVLQQTLENVLHSFEEVLVVLRHDDETFAEQLLSLFGRDKLEAFCAPDSELGMGHSLANAVVRVTDWDGLFIFLGDMPHLSNDTIDTLKTTLSNAIDSVSLTQPPTNQRPPIVVPVCDGRQGHPAGFASSYLDEIAGLDGDKGGKPVILNNIDAVIKISVQDRGVLTDIDTQNDICAS